MSSRIEWGVEIEFDGEKFISPAETEEQARQYRAACGGELKVRRIFETSWANAPNG